MHVDYAIGEGSDETVAEDSVPTGRPRSRANSAPWQEARLVATAATSKPWSTRLRRLVPRPETRTPSFTARTTPAACPAVRRLRPPRDSRAGGARKRAPF